MKKKIIIIGGGIAGLSAGVYAQKAGFASEIYEKNQIAGGQCMGWDRKNHHIDNCIHWLTGTKKGTELYKLWETIGAIGDGIEMAKNDKFFTSTLDGKSATLWKDLDRTKRELLEIAPEDSEEINKLVKYIKLTENCEIPAEKPMDMMNILGVLKLVMKMSDMFKLIKEYGKISIEDLGNRFSNPLLSKLMTDYIPKEHLASAFLFSYASVVSGNGNIPLKGSLAMTNRIIDRYKKLGGVLHTNMQVKNTDINKNRASGIVLNDGTKVLADYVICTTDTFETFNKLIDKSYMDAKMKKCYEDRKDYPVFSGFQMAFSINSKAVESGTTCFDCKPLEVANKSVGRISVNCYDYDSSFAPEGKTVLQSNIFQTEEDFAYWKSLDIEDYKKQKLAISNAVTERITENFPQLNGQIELLDCWTPLTYERYCNSFKGAYMAFTTKKNIKPYMFKGSLKGLENVFIASQWLQTPGGLPIAVMTGKFAIQRILKQLGMSTNL